MTTRVKKKVKMPEKLACSLKQPILDVTRRSIIGSDWYDSDFNALSAL